MSFTILQLRFRVRVAAGAFLEQGHASAAAVAATPGLVWKIWLRDDDDASVGGVYLFRDRTAAQRYLAGPIVAGLRSHPAVIACDAAVWEAHDGLSALTGASLAAMAGERR